MSFHSSLTTIELLTTVLSGLTAVAGLYIGYQAYRGLRRNESEPMRYLSIGLILLFGVAYITAFAGTALLRAGSLPLLYQEYLRLGVRVVQLLGVSAIAYSLYLTGERGPAGSQ
jgi:hypothetical protein